MELSVLAIIARDIERELHRRFETQRVVGEWFPPTVALLDSITAVSSTSSDAEARA
jgi:hypothetical protein